MKVIKLTRGKLALISDRDFTLVKKYKWQAMYTKGLWYATCALPNGRRGPPQILMHRLIMGFPSGGVDHRDRNGLNNQRSNLRPASQTQNNGNMRRRKDNTSGYKGVGIHTQTGLWRARVRAYGKQKHLGLFHSRKEAALAYEKAAKEIFGEFARI